MPRILLSISSLAAFLSLAIACSSGTVTTPTGDGGTDGGTDGTLTYRSDPCGSGDPVGCSFANAVEVPDAKYQKCSALGIVEGAACTGASEPCVLTPARKEGGDAGPGCTQSASYLTCRAEARDPGPAGCPKSTRSAKKNIRYLGAPERAKLTREVLDLAIATYDYKDESDGPSPSTGFILEDAPHASFVLRDHSRVNMYSYVSSLVVTVQEQQSQIDELRSELAKIRAASGQRSPARTRP